MYRFVERHKKAWPIVLMCQVLKLSVSAYYAWRKRPESIRKLENNALIPLVQEIHKSMRQSYGTRRMAKELRKRSIKGGAWSCFAHWQAFSKLPKQRISLGVPS